MQGFHRYSTDMRWHVPHFEKMLYDNAQLVATYADATRIARARPIEGTALRDNTTQLFQSTIKRTLDYVQSNLTHAVSVGECVGE